MSRKYVNDKWCVRCGKCDPTPYLKKHWDKHIVPNLRPASPNGTKAIDIGCGNGRNTEWLRSMGFDTVPFDMVKDYGFQFSLGNDKFPLFKKSVDLILANYIFMFLDKRERKQVYEELRRVAAYGAIIVVELYPAKDSHAVNDEELEELQEEIMKELNAEKIHYIKQKFIARII
jgi:trans-aconitate methyltransferase